MKIRKFGFLMLLQVGVGAKHIVPNNRKEKLGTTYLHLLKTTPIFKFEMYYIKLNHV